MTLTGVYWGCMAISREKFYQDCENNEFLKVGIQPPYLVRETPHMEKSKDVCFHKRHNHNIDDCVHLKDDIERIINRGHLSEYVKGMKDIKE